MLWSFLGLLLALYVIQSAVKSGLALRRNIAAAKQTGLPYFITPVFPLTRFWLVLGPWLIKPFRKLPRSWTEPSLTLLTAEWIWKYGYGPFRRFGSDTFLVVSPGPALLISCSAEVVSQVFARRNDFPKPIQFYNLLEIYGRNVVSTEGAVWRHHRRITAAPFTEKNNEIVWAESLEQARHMLSHWEGRGRDGDGLAAEVAADTMRLTLNIISRAGFGMPLGWPSQVSPLSTTHEMAPSSGDEIPDDHRLSFKDALETLLESCLLLLLVPHGLLKWAPIKTFQRAETSFVEWRRYMSEMFERKKSKVLEGRDDESFDLMEALVRGAGISGEAEDGGECANGKDKQLMAQPLSDAEIMGNAFVLLLAGHETTANTVHFALVFLAMYPSSQARLQEDITNILGDRPVEEWNLEHDMPKLFAGMAGAVMNETLRLLPPVTAIFKSVSSTPQALNVEGRSVLLPGGTLIHLDTIAAHRHPTYWPNPDKKSSEDHSEDHLAQFRPERWFIDNSSSPDTSVPPTKGGASSTGPTSRSTLPKNVAASDPGDEDHRARHTTAPFHPVRGSYFPFSDGARACLGRRFAQVEVMAVLAVIFRDYSVELAVSGDDADADADDDTTTTKEDDDDDDEAIRRAKWEKARQRAEYLTTKGMATVLTLRMRKGKVPLRLVKRGRERYRFDR